MSDSQNKASALPFDLSLFREPERARQNLDRLHARAPSGLLAAILGLLAELPDPDQALNLFERLASPSGDQIIPLLDKHRILLHHVLVLFGHSYWLGEALLANHDVLFALQREKGLHRSLDREDFRQNFARLRSRSLETDVSLLLARFKKREYIRIALRDLLGIAALAETTAEISALTDIMIEEALQEAQRTMRIKQGNPEYQDAHGRLAEAPFAVLSMGKLGGNELNYSSDVDLLFLYSDHDSAGALSLREYFVRQAQLVTDILSRSTPEGTVFRVDLRLRPQGDEGEPAVGLKHALNYYAHAAHDWELQALIKVRHCAGDAALAREFIRGVQDRVYTKTVNFAAMETGLHSREKMGARRRHLIAVGKEPETLDVKLDRGGIRDIEFLVQCLQRVYGGEERWLRSGGTLFSLQKLHDKGHISGKDFHDLTQAYEFLRRVEHRLQLQRGRQLHRLPADQNALHVLHRSVAFGARDPGGVNASAFLFTLQTHMARVSEIYQRILHIQKQEIEGAANAPSTPAMNARELSFDQLLQRIAADSPELHDVAARGDLSLHARRNLHRFLSSALTSAQRYAAILESPQAVARAMVLFETSDYLTDILVRHPDAICALNQVPAMSSEVARGTTEEAPASSEALLASNEALAQLRRNFRTAMFAAGAQDILAPRPAFNSMRETTQLADTAIRSALQSVGTAQSLTVFALGRLGTEEFDIASDADLLFVRAPESDAEEARLDAERLVHALAAYTREGSVFAVDARLRPRGGEGELVVTPEQVRRYLAKEAQSWEALTYTKLRFVAGREDLAPLVLTQTWHQIVEIAARPGFAAAVAEMRTRLEKSNRYPGSFKLARGGFYDVDFIASYLMLYEASLAQGNTLDRLEYLRQLGSLDNASFNIVRDAAVLYRTADHVIRLVTGRARPELPAAEHARGAVETLVNRILGRDAASDLQTDLRETAEKVRTLFTQILEV